VVLDRSVARMRRWRRLQGVQRGELWHLVMEDEHQVLVWELVLLKGFQVEGSVDEEAVVVLTERRWEVGASWTSEIFLYILVQYRRTINDIPSGIKHFR